MKKGWICLHRNLLDKAIWRCSTPEQKSVLITLLLLASHKENQWIWKGEKFKCQPGQFISSLQSIAKASRCTVMNVRTSLLKFKKLQFLTNESTKAGRLISIVNWADYQEPNNRPNKDTNKELTKHQQRANTYQQCNNVTKKNKGTIYSEEFLKFYSAYPVKKSKKDAFKYWKKYQPDLNTCLVAIANQTKERKRLKNQEKFAPPWKHPSTWINQNCWEDSTEEPRGREMDWK